MKSKGKNAVIELMRFIFASAVVVFHAQLDLWKGGREITRIAGHRLMLFRNGYIGVEFFFIVSGYLMAKSIYKAGKNGYAKDPGKETTLFVWRKMKALLPYYIPVCIIMALISILRKGEVSYVIVRLPSLFFLQNTAAFPNSFIGATWYISSMLIAMTFLYPLCRKYYRTYTLLIAPLAAVIIIGALIHNTGNLGGGPKWLLITYKANLRAFAELGAGAFCHEMGRRIEKREFNTSGRVILSLTAFVCYAAAIMYIFSDCDRIYSGYCFYLLCTAVTITFSNKGIAGSAEAAGNRFLLYLGEISLPLYLCQNINRTMVPILFGSFSKEFQVLFIYTGTLIMAVILNTAVKAVKEKKS